MAIQNDFVISPQVFDVVLLQRLMSRTGLNCDITGWLGNDQGDVLEKFHRNLLESWDGKAPGVKQTRLYSAEFAKLVERECQGQGVLCNVDMEECAGFLGVKLPIMYALFSVFVNRAYLSCTEINTPNEDMDANRRMFDLERFLSLVSIRKGVGQSNEIRRYIQLYLSQHRVNPALFTRSECYVRDEELATMARTGGMFGQALTNWAVLDYSSCFEMSQAYLSSEKAQLLDFCKEIRDNRVAYTALKNVDFSTFAKAFRKGVAYPGTHLANTFLACF